MTGDNNRPSCARKNLFLYCRCQLENRSFSNLDRRDQSRVSSTSQWLRRCAEQEVDPRFSRLAALTLANQTNAKRLGIKTGAREAKPQTLQFRRRPNEEERGSEFFASGITNARAARRSFGDFGPPFFKPLSFLPHLITFLAVPSALRLTT